MKFFHDEGVVLRKHDVGEKDEVVILLMKHHGKMAFMAKGSRDPMSRKAGALQIFNTIAFQARQGKGKMPYLEQVKSLKARSFSIVGTDSLDDFYRASEVLRLTDVFIQESQNVHNVYDDLNRVLEVTSVGSVVLIYWIRLFQDLGFVPDWASCCDCHGPLSLEEPIVFSPENKGFAHRACFSLPLSEAEPSMVKLMSFFQKADIADSIRVEVDENLLNQVRNALEQIQNYSKH